MTKSFVSSLYPPTNNLHTEEPLKVDPIPLESLISDVPRMILGLIRNIKRKFMAGVTFLIFILTTSACDG